MTYPHTIQLRAPWELRPLMRENESLATGPPLRVEVPGESPLTPVDEQLGLRYSRRFNRPTGIDPHERVWLCCDGADPSARVSLGEHELGHILGYALPWEADVTTHLAPHNELIIEVLPADALRPGREHRPGGLIRDVRLEVRSRHWLAQCSLSLPYQAGVTRLRFSAQVNGPPGSGPLHVALSHDQRELAYQPVEIGESFTLSADLSDLRPWSLGEPNRLGTFEVKLLSAHGAIWRREYVTAPLGLAWEGDRLRVLGEAIALPLPATRFPLTPANDTQCLAALAATARRPLASLEILADAWYSRFDEQGIAVAQMMPRQWAPALCPLLAHHPSIVAWVAPPDEDAAPAAAIDWANRPRIPFDQVVVI